MEEQRRATQEQLHGLLSSGFIDESKYEQLKTSLQPQPISPFTWSRISQIIVCFFADGSDKYTQMTTMAISSFLDKTPQIAVGLLTHDREVRNKVVSSIDPRHHGRVIWKKTSEQPYLLNWNPTQYKLDIQKFTEDGFESIFWMDSDTLTFEDMTPFLLSFADSNKQFFFVRDHVTFNSEFVSNWTRERPLGVIPQACFMGFKYSIIRPFFQLWKEIWAQWITPVPFFNFPDPNPQFVGSMFCIEQYALAMALAQFLGEHHLGEDAVLLFERELILLQHDGRLSFDVVTKIPASISGGLVSISGLSGLRFSGINLSGLGYRMSGLQVSGINISGLGSGLNLSGINLSGVSVSGLQSLLSGLSLSGSGLNISGLSGLNLSGLSQYGAGNASGLNVSGLSLAGTSINLSGIDYKYLQQGDLSSPTNITVIDKFGNSFIHYYHQNFDPLKEGSLQGGQFTQYFSQRKEDS